MNARKHLNQDFTSLLKTPVLFFLFFAATGCGIKFYSEVSEEVTTPETDISVTVLSLAITSPQSGTDFTTNTAAQTVSGTCSVNAINLTTSLGAFSDSDCSNGTWALNAYNLNVGVNTFTIGAEDSSGALVSDTMIITYDNSAPSLAVTSPNGGTSFTTITQSQTVSGTCSTDATNLSTSIGSFSDNDCSDGTWSLNAYNTSLGANTFTIGAEDAAGNTISDAITITYSPCPATATPTVAPVYLNNGGNGTDKATWNSYVRNYGSGTNTYDRNDTACLGTENGYRQCVHGGEKLKATLTGLSSCTGLTIADSEGAFDWVCSEATNPVKIYTKGLKANKNLSDLIVGTGDAFKDMKVSVTDSNTCLTHESALATWWSNTVQTAPSSAAATQTLSTTGRIYTLTGNATGYGYNIDGNKIGLVMLGGSELTLSVPANNCRQNSGETGVPDMRSPLCVGTQHFIWIEGKFNGANLADSEIILFGSSFLRMRNSGVRRNAAHGVLAREMTSSLFENSNFYNNGESGLQLYSASNYNSVHNIKTAFNHGGEGGFLIDAGDNNTVQNIISYSNTGAGIRYNRGDNNTLVGAVVVANDAPGVEQFDGLNYGDYHMITSINNATYGSLLTGGTNDVYTNMVLINNAWEQLYVVDWTGTPSDNKWKKLLAYETAANGNEVIEIANATNQLFYSPLYIRAADCGVSGSAGTQLADPTCNHNAGNATAPILLTIDDTIYKGAITSTDSQNVSNSNGTQAFAGLTDLLNFESFFRAWGIYLASPFPVQATMAGPCEAGITCQIWDWRLRTTDTVLRNISGAFSTGACPASVDASNIGNVMVDSRTAPQSYLISAMEIWGDDIGDDDGLCESSEACIYNPNIGYYLGEGSYINPTATCTYTGGNGVTGVTMYGLTTNGI